MAEKSGRKSGKTSASSRRTGSRQRSSSKKGSRWSQQVTEKSDALTLEEQAKDELRRLYDRA